MYCGDAGLLQSATTIDRSEEHTSELQSLTNLVCRLLLEKTIVGACPACCSMALHSALLPRLRRVSSMSPPRLRRMPCETAPDDTCPLICLAHYTTVRSYA